MKEDTTYLKELSVNDLLQEFWKDNRHFADLFNYYLFGGHEVLEPDKLREADSNVSVNIFSRQFGQTIRRFRDVIKISDNGKHYRILAIEDQQAIHYAMPFRSLVYDVLTMVKQMKAIEKENRIKKKCKGKNEFLSAWTKEDRLVPCYTLVIYWGEEPWDGPRTLADMMDFSSDEKEKGFYHNYFTYNMKLLCVNELCVFEEPSSDVSQLFIAVRELYRQEGKSLPNSLSDVSVEVARIAAMVAKVPEVYEKAVADAEKNGKGRVNMCKALDKAFADREMEARKEMIIDMFKAGLSFEKVLEIVKGKISEEELREIKLKVKK